MPRKGPVRVLVSELQAMDELEQLKRVWSRLTPRWRAAILVLAGIRKAPEAKPERRQFERTAKGETPAWLLPALNLLKDTGGNLPDREIARRMGISHALLSRNQTYQNAKKAYFVPQSEAGRKDPSVTRRKSKR